MADATSFEEPVRESAEVPASRDRARDTRRQAILEAAESVFAERGFGGATMAEIAARAGYSAGNLYNVFENKESLFSEVLTTRVQALLESVQGVLAQDGSIADLIDRYLDVTFRFVADHRDLFVILTQANADFDWHDPGTDDGPIRNQLNQGLEDVFARAIERGEIPAASPRSYACLLQGMPNTHLARWARGGGETDELFAPLEDFRTILKRALRLAP